MVKTMKTGCRYQRAIKQSLNRMMGNRASVNSNIASIISSFSHKTTISPGSYLLCPQYHFFIVCDVLSAHWCEGFFCPPMIDTMYGLFAPDLRRRTAIQKKCIFDPFVRPYVAIRNQKFRIKDKVRYEPLPNLQTLFT